MPRQTMSIMLGIVALVSALAVAFATGRGAGDQVAIPETGSRSSLYHSLSGISGLETYHASERNLSGVAILADANPLAVYHDSEHTLAPAGPAAWSFLGDYRASEWGQDGSSSP